MATKSYGSIKAEKKKKVDALITETKMFFAFSNEQFQKNKSPLKEGEKYVSLGAGAYMPKSNIELWKKGSDEIDKWYKSELKKAKQDEAAILYELRNHEAFYTGDIEDTCDALQTLYTKEEVEAVFRKHRKEEFKNQSY